MEEKLEERTLQMSVADLMFIQDQMSEWFKTDEHFTHYRMNPAAQMDKARGFYKAIQERIQEFYGKVLNEGERKDLGLDYL
jgi:hypothetical protein